MPKSAPPATGLDRCPSDGRPPVRPTQARLQVCFLRHLALSGSVGDAAARAGVAPRTVQRWRAANPAFARRYGEVLAQRIELLEDLAMRRACGTDRRPVFHRGKQVATVERHNDVMLMRVLARFDRLRERAWRRDHVQASEDAIRLLDEAGERAARCIRRTEEKPLSQLSSSMRQLTDAGVDR